MGYHVYTHTNGRSVRTRQRPDEIRRVVRRYEAGETIPQLAAATGHSTGAIHDWLTALGVVRDGEWAMRLLHGTEDLPEQAARLYLAGHSLRAIATMLDSTYSGVQRALQRAGVDRRTKRDAQAITPRRRASHRRAVQVCRLIAGGMKYAQAARQLGISRTMARNYWLSDANPYRVEDPADAEVVA